MEEVLPECKQPELRDTVDLMDLDNNLIRMILRKKAQTADHPSVLFALAATCRTMRDILRDPAEAGIWEAAWESYKVGGKARGRGIDKAGGTARQRCLLLTARRCTLCKQQGPPRALIWPFLQRCCFECRRKHFISDAMLLMYGVTLDRLKGLTFYDLEKQNMPLAGGGRGVAYMYSLDDLKPVLRDTFGTDDFDEVTKQFQERLTQMWGPP